MSIESFRASDGVGLAYHRVRPDEHADLGVPVFLLHGLSSDSETSWIGPGFVRTLEALGREVFAVDARGHGSSDKPHDSDLYGETTMSRDVIELWDSLALHEVDLVGHGMGAVVALITASSDRRIRRLVLSGVGQYLLDYDGGPLPYFDAAGAAAALSIEDPSTITDPRLREFRAEIDKSANDRQALAAHLRVFHTNPFAFEKVEAPTLVIAGQDDTLSPRPDLLAGAIPNGTSLVTPGDHIGAKTTAAFMNAVAAFLDDPP